MNCFSFNCCENVLIIFTMVHFAIANDIPPNKQKYNKSWTHNKAEHSVETIVDLKSRGFDEMVNIPVFPLYIEPQNKIGKRSAPTAKISADGWNDCVCPFVTEKFEIPLLSGSHTYVYSVRCNSPDELCPRMKGAEANHMACSQDYTSMSFYYLDRNDNFTLRVPTGCSCRVNKTMTKTEISTHLD